MDSSGLLAVEVRVYFRTGLIVLPLSNNARVPGIPGREEPRPAGLLSTPNIPIHGCPGSRSCTLAIAQSSRWIFRFGSTTPALGMTAPTGVWSFSPPKLAPELDADLALAIPRPSFRARHARSPLTRDLAVAR